MEKLVVLPGGGAVAIIDRLRASALRRATCMTPYYIFSSACIPAIGGHLWGLGCDVILPNESLSFFRDTVPVRRAPLRRWRPRSKSSPLTPCSQSPCKALATAFWQRCSCITGVLVRSFCPRHLQKGCSARVLPGSRPGPNLAEISAVKLLGLCCSSSLP